MSTPASIPSLAPITVAILAALTTGTGRQIGDSRAPDDAVPSYGFLTRVDTIWTGSLLSDYEMATVTYQLQCVGLDAAGAGWLENRAQIALQFPPAVAGWHFIDWEPLGSPGGVRPDRDTTPHLYFSTPQWRAIAQPGPA